MMRWVAVFTNKPGTAALKQANLHAHLAFIAAHPEITLAGSTTPRGKEHSTGGVWVINGVTYAEAMQLCEQDPLFAAGIRDTIDVFAYQLAPQFEDLV